jgi:hypothetical protein
MKKSILGLALTVITCQSLAYECAYDNILSSTPIEKFLINNDGTVTDLRFGLMWTTCTFGQTFEATTGRCVGNATNVPLWSDALSSQDSLNENTFAGFNTWRLPNAKELQTIIERACRNPAIRSDVFPDSINAVYWTNTPDDEVNPQLKARIIDFADGSEFFKATSEKLYIRHVRSINQ